MRLLAGVAAGCTLYSASTSAEVRPALATPVSSVLAAEPPMRLGVTDATPRRNDVARLQTTAGNGDGLLNV
jgi:hypothetical protein